MKEEKLKTNNKEELQVCKICGLNPNSSQSKEQQKWESDYVKKHKGICSACLSED